MRTRGDREAPRGAERSDRLLRGSPADLLVRSVQIDSPPLTRAESAVTEAIVLAGSHATTLCPLAGTAPHFTFPVANEPAIEHLIRALGRMGVRRAIVAGAATRAIARTGRVNVSVHAEPTPWGTAGAVRELAGHLDVDEMLVVDGSLVDVDLDVDALLETHRRHSAGLTVVAVAGRAGGGDEIEINERGALAALRVPYAPADGAALRCAGIYVVGRAARRLIPAGCYFDIKDQLVPLLRRESIPVAGFVAGGVRRIGSIDDYLATNRAMIEAGAVPPGAREVRPGVWAEPEAELADGAELRGPVLLGRGARIEDGASVIGPAAIGASAVVRRGAVVRDSVLWPRAEVRHNARLTGVVVTEAGVVPAGRVLERTAVVDVARCDGNLAVLRQIAGGARRDLSIVLTGGPRGRLVPGGRAPLRRRGYLAAKRAMDAGGALAGLVLLAPVMLAAAIAIRLDSRGPVLFRQRRCGRGGRPFTMLKFRTMVAGADACQSELRASSVVDGPVFKLAKDPRVTRVGRFLRVTSLDELPQLLNVLRGEMSLVGPRPLVMDEMRCAPGWRDIRLMVKPGITGLWQAHGRCRTRFADWIQLDVEYVRSQSLMLDLRIILRTLGVVAGQEGAR
jgi:lipopolysaccharide/colanic/teichoic acid biosynthesis glycosyltransferase/ADP-glucose pyrophosphorylase